MNGIFYITLHHDDSNKQDSSTIANICVSKSGICSHAWTQMLKIGVCESVSCIYGCLLFWDIVKILQTCCFGNFGHVRTCPSKMIVSTCRKLWCLSEGKNSTSSLTSFDRHCKRYCKLVILGAYLVKHTQNLGENM